MVNLDILWVDDMRNPVEFLSKESSMDSDSWKRSVGFYKALRKDCNVNPSSFAWVKNCKEFANYLEQNGVPSMVSFDRDLGNGNTGEKCAEILRLYCKKTKSEIPMYFIHSANVKNRGKIEDELGADKNMSNWSQYQNIDFISTPINWNGNDDENFLGNTAPRFNFRSDMNGKTSSINWGPNLYARTKHEQDNITDNKSVYKIHLPKSGLDCFSLYDLPKGELSPIIKKNMTGGGVRDREVKWEGDSKEMFLNYAAKHAAYILNKAIEKIKKDDNTIEMGYITYPSSSSDFNNYFCNKLLPLVGAEKIIPDYIMKSRHGIVIDEYTARAIGCDASDVAELKEWIAEEEAKDDIIPLRKQMESNLSMIANDISNDKIDNNFQYTKSGEEGLNKLQRGLESNKLGVVFKKNSPWSGKNEKDIDVTNKHTGQNGKISISKNFYDISSKLKDKMADLEQKYGSLERAFNKIESERQSDISSKKFNTIKKSKAPSKTNWDLHYNPLLKSQERANKALDSTYKNGEIIDKDWTIKHKAEWARKILYRLFSIDATKEDFASPIDKKKKIIIIFDDNMSGGATMDNACLAMYEGGWENIIPIVLSTMPVTVDPDATAQYGPNTPGAEKMAKNSDRNKVNGIDLKRLGEKSRQKFDIDDKDALGNFKIQQNFTPNEKNAFIQQNYFPRKAKPQKDIHKLTEEKIKNIICEALTEIIKRVLN